MRQRGGGTQEEGRKPTGQRSEGEQLRVGGAEVKIRTLRRYRGAHMVLSGGREG